MSNLDGDFAFLPAATNATVDEPLDFSTHARGAVSPFLEHTHRCSRNLSTHHEFNPGSDRTRQSQREFGGGEMLLRDARLEPSAVNLRHGPARERFFIEPFEDLLKPVQLTVGSDAVRAF